jgi:hypothetical protein
MTKKATLTLEVRNSDESITKLPKLVTKLPIPQVGNQIVITGASYEVLNVSFIFHKKPKKDRVALLLKELVTD